MLKWLRIVLKLQNFFFSRRGEHELCREIDAHLALMEHEFQRRGMNPDEARSAARRALGGVEQAKELHREERSLLWLEEALQDLRFALTALVKNSRFTVVAVLTLALGIGANSGLIPTT